MFIGSVGFASVSTWPMVSCMRKIFIVTDDVVLSFFLMLSTVDIVVLPFCSFD